MREEAAMKRSRTFRAVIVLGGLLMAPSSPTAAQTVATAGVGGTYPPATTFAGVAVTGLHSGFGAEIDVAGSGIGQFSAILLGVTPTGTEQPIRLEGEVTSGLRIASNVAVLSGITTVDLGDGLPPAEGVPFTLTVTVDANGMGTLGLTTDLASLPEATVNAGSITIN
jgi:hypothetical protein